MPRSDKGRPGVLRHRHTHHIEWFEAFATRLAFNWPTRARLYRMLSARLKNNIQIDLVLRMYAGQLLRRRRKSTSRMVDGIAARMQNHGTTFAEAIRPWVPADEMLMIASGERANNLGDAMELIGDVKARIQRIKGALRSAAFNPVAYIAMIYGYMWAIGTYLTPQLTKVLPPERAVGMASWLYTLGDAATGWPVPAALLIGAAVVGFTFWAMPNYTGRLRLVLERGLPFSFYRDIQGYMWLLSFVALLRAGMPDTTALETQMANGSPWLRHRLGAILPLMRNEGLLLPTALRVAGHEFPNPDMIDDIEAVSGFAQSQEMLFTATKQWASELDDRLNAQIKRLGFAFEMLMYGVIIFILAATNDLSEQLSAGTGPLT